MHGREAKNTFFHFVIRLFGCAKGAEDNFDIVLSFLMGYSTTLASNSLECTLLIVLI